MKEKIIKLLKSENSEDRALAKELYINSNTCMSEQELELELNTDVYISNNRIVSTGFVATIRKFIRNLENDNLEI